MTAIAIKDLTKTFGSGANRRKALNALSLQVEKGEMVALIGASGSGKSTLIRHMIGLTLADRGTGNISVFDQNVQAGGRISRSIRQTRVRVGVVFQQFNLVSRLPLLTNVLVGFLGSIPTWRGLLGLFTHQEKLLAMQALKRVGLAEYASQRASTLSGGQQQRAAIARALVQHAQVILADEPIASLDPEASRKVMDHLSALNREDGTTVVVSLHQVDYAIRYCPRTVALHEGIVVYDGPSANLTPELLKSLYGSDSDELLVPQRPRNPVVLAPKSKTQQGRLVETPALAAV
ncbi:MAG: phosphonate ABC transporter ATP-binding protein [Rhodospirillales bacterium]|nr:phosphonate ABC transporter ATP-binding protein [Rhodospirillales bacterium]